jgi:hypothetical protein
MLICSYCHTTLYWDEDAIIKTGQESRLPEINTRLHLNAIGRLEGRRFRVAGHIRYQYGEQLWDEWYLAFLNGQTAWLSEDERQLSLERPLKGLTPTAIPSPAALRIGLTIVLDGQGYMVREVGRATCIGAEGQLPRTFLAGETYAYADLAAHDSNDIASLEYDVNNRPHAFGGRALQHEQLQIEGEKAAAEAATRTMTPTEASGIACAHCAAPLRPSTQPAIETVVCAHCGGVNEVHGAIATLLGVNPKNFDPGFVFTIGQVGEFEGQKYEICGRLLYRDYEDYSTREYLLYNENSGYLWLSEEEGHYVLNRSTRQALPFDPLASLRYLTPKTAVTIGGRSYKFYETGEMRLRYVDGALPWKARINNSFTYGDFVAPPEMLSLEIDGSEIETFHGRYLAPQAIQTAFRLKEPLLWPYGVHAAQPFNRTSLRRNLMVVGLVFGLINLALLFGAYSRKGIERLDQTFSSHEYAGEAFSIPFEVGPEPIMSITLQADIYNSWLSLDAALVNSASQVIEEMDAEISYYAGQEGGESWTEGRRKNTVEFRAPPPGRYKLLIHASGGSGDADGPGLGESCRIIIRQGMTLVVYFWLMLLLCLTIPAVEIFLQVAHELKRWAPVVEGDDDD